MLTGFHNFYFEGRSYPGRPITPPIRSLVILHGCAMSAWMLIFLVQPLLILAKNRKLHRKVGTVGAVIAACAFLLGMKLGVESARFKPPGMIAAGMNPIQFMAVPILTMLEFGVCIAAAIIYRNKAPLHRTLMLIGTLCAIPAAVGRIDPLNNLYAGTVFERIWGVFFMTLVLALLLLGLKCVLSRKLDRNLAIGCIGLALFFAFDTQFAMTRAWDGVAHLLLRVMA